MTWNDGELRDSRKQNIVRMNVLPRELNDETRQYKKRLSSNNEIDNSIN